MILSPERTPGTFLTRLRRLRFTFRRFSGARRLGSFTSTSVKCNSAVSHHVHFVGWRVEANGTVLRFQAPTYEEIYSLLPILLAPFHMSQAVDWGETLRQLPGQERGLILTELARIEAAAPGGLALRGPFG